MTETELYEKLKATGYPVAHREFSRSPTIPYIVYVIESEERRGSDSKNLLREMSVKVELYTEYSDTQSQEKLDTTLDFVEFRKNSYKIKEERLIQTIYEFNILSKLGG